VLDFLKINQLIDIEIEPGADYNGRYRTRVEDLNDNGIVIGMPIECGNLIPLRPETEVIIWHWDNSATYAYYCKVQKRIFEPLPLVFLRWPFRSKKIQRRSLVRVPTNIKIEYALIKKEEEKSGEVVFNNSHVRDLSGGGAQFISQVKLQKGDILKIKLYLPDGTISCKSKVVWLFDEAHKKMIRHVVGIGFIDIPEKVRDKIIRYVFARQRELINKGVL